MKALVISGGGSKGAFASGASFTVCGLLPFLVTLFLPLHSMEYAINIF